MDKQVKEAIEKSISQNEIVTIEAVSPTDGVVLDLIYYCDGNADSLYSFGMLLEFWGKSGLDTWRVNVKIPC